MYIGCNFCRREYRVDLQTLAYTADKELFPFRFEYCQRWRRGRESGAAANIAQNIMREMDCAYPWGKWTRTSLSTRRTQKVRDDDAKIQ